ncbi:MAG: hypothetical protein CME70_00315 [Halobacteriovorax sp.]|nr:hypothetical protein [Halobacteriovorax sp.]|tara:strand:+ start:7900 stop:8694 length:795 start_codon:yes stop_codon:yes gene_type:complete
MKKILFILLFTVSSCKEYAQYQRKDYKVTIVPTQAGISSVDVAKWKVGPLRRQEVSKGVRVKVNFPLLEKEQLKDLVNSMEIDSWLIRIKRRTLITNEVLDSFYVPLILPGRGKTDLRIKQIPAGFVNLYYSAAAVSTRFEKFNCPAFDHRRIVEEFEIKKVESRTKSIRGNRRTPSYYNRKLTPYTYSPFPVNGGKELNGEYHFEIALFNSKEKTKKSNWFAIGEAVKITKESTLPSIKGCKNFKIPERDSKIDEVQDFKFGR